MSHTFTSPNVFLGTTFTRNHNLFACRLTTTLLIDKISQQYRQTFKLSNKKFKLWELKIQICPGLNANEIKIPCDKHHKVSSLVKSLQNTHSSVKDEVKSLHMSQVKSLHTSQVAQRWSTNMKMSNNHAKHEVVIKQYLYSILDTSEKNRLSLVYG